VELDDDSSRDNGQGDGLNRDDLLNAASWELVEKPTYHVSVKAIVSLPTLILIVAYFCTFGTELAVNSFLGAFYLKNFPHLGQTGSDRWVRTFPSVQSILREKDYPKETRSIVFNSLLSLVLRCADPRLKDQC